MCRCDMLRTDAEFSRGKPQNFASAGIFSQFFFGRGFFSSTGRIFLSAVKRSTKSTPSYGAERTTSRSRLRACDSQNVGPAGQTTAVCYCDSNFHRTAFQLFLAQPNGNNHCFLLPEQMTASFIVANKDGARQSSSMGKFTQ
jgi:hypothetical protein